MRKLLYLSLIILSISYKNCFAQLPPVFTGTHQNDVQSDPTVRKYLSPVKIIWQSPKADDRIKNAGQLLNPGIGQASLAGKDYCTIRNVNGEQSGLVLDFGRELHGGLQLITDQSKGSFNVAANLVDVHVVELNNESGKTGLGGACLKTFQPIGKPLPINSM